MALSASRSPVGELTAGSNGLVVTLADVVTGSVGPGAAPPGPYSFGAMSQAPGAIGLAANDAAAVVPNVEAMSGSPLAVCESNWMARDPVVLACRLILVEFVGTR